jgi:NAD+ diphosphatase
LLGKDKESGGIYFAVELPGDDAEAPGRFAGLGEFKDLVKTGARTDRRHGAILAYARAITYWNRGHRFCGVCGSPTRSAEAGHLRVCTGERCKREHFPRTDPAIIVLVNDGEKCLLGRSTRWPGRLYSTIAGFVEPGESLEMAVAREVMEETGVLVDPGRAVYHSSQPWPFPSSLMLGFTAYARRGEIRVDRSELEDARWFSREELRKAIIDGTIYLPLKFSIAYRLIDDWRNSG